MLRQFLYFVAATFCVAPAPFADGSTALAAAAAGRLVLILFLILPVLSAGANILKGPPPI